MWPENSSTSVPHSPTRATSMTASPGARRRRFNLLDAPPSWTLDDERPQMRPAQGVSGSPRWPTCATKDPAGIRICRQGRRLEDPR